MAQYYMLADMYSPLGYYLQAGTIQTTADVGGQLPANWVPGPMVDPQDAAALAAYRAAGPQVRGLIRTQFTNLPVNIPVHNWSQDQNGKWSLS